MGARHSATPLSALALGVVWSVAVFHLQSVAPTSAQTVPSDKVRLEQLRVSARTDVAGAAAALRSMDPARMDSEDRATWARLSRDTALRAGDRATLVALKNEPDPLGRLPEAYIILAHAFMDIADFTAARAELGKVGDLEGVTPRDQRRYWALKAKLARLEGHVGEEREAIEHIVHELGKWPGRACQACHDDPKRPEVLPLLDVQQAWFATRFVELMRQQHDADAVAARAERALATNAADADARIFLGFARLARHDAAGADAAFRELPWFKVPGRDGAAPRALFSWP